jgi:voltage-gated potassium channel
MEKKWRHRLHDAFFEHETPSGKTVDIFLLLMIFLSITVVMLDSVSRLHQQYGLVFHRLEWFFTILFTLEYVLRISLSPHPAKFVFSFLGLVDLIAILPTYISLFMAGFQSLLIMRALRLLRIFRIFRLSHFLTDLQFLSRAMRASFRKISIFLLFALVIVIIMGSVMYIVEDPKNGFTSIPQCIYWAVSTITTVGYGDVVPITPMGKVIANIVMLIGFAIIAVPTGIITTEMSMAIKTKEQGRSQCKSCNKSGHDLDASYCKHCGSKFQDDLPEG